MSGGVGTNDRFAFGRNWQGFLSVLDDDRIDAAERSLCEMLEVTDLGGRTFLDAGSGSGLMSLAARRLNAEVTSFDYDPDSVDCTRKLKHLYFRGDPAWSIRRGSVLDLEFLRTLGRFDVVYCWGVLHHTGSMWRGLDHVSSLVKPRGQLFIAIYNDQGSTSERWRTVKRLYNRMPTSLGLGMVIFYGSYAALRRVLKSLLRLQNPIPVDTARARKQHRGMSIWYDLVDWVGGYPFEVAKPEEVFEFCRQRGFRLDRLTTCGGHHGCNQFVLTKPTKTATDRRGDSVASIVTSAS